MEIKYGGRLPQWRYRAISAGASGGGAYARDDYEREAESRLSDAGLPWCFGEMSYPHWRRIPPGGGFSTSYSAGDNKSERRTALERMILCSRCPVFERCHKLAMAKKSPNPMATMNRARHDMLAALAFM